MIWNIVKCSVSKDTVNCWWDIMCFSRENASKILPWIHSWEIGANKFKPYPVPNILNKHVCMFLANTRMYENGSRSNTCFWLNTVKYSNQISSTYTSIASVCLAAHAHNVLSIVEHLRGTKIKRLVSTLHPCWNRFLKQTWGTHLETAIRDTNHLLQDDCSHYPNWRDTESWASNLADFIPNVFSLPFFLSFPSPLFFPI